MNTRHLTLATAALAVALTVSACGSNDLATGTTPASAPAASPASPTAHGGGHGGTRSAPLTAPAGRANDADLSFLAGMEPHHRQAVEMSDVVLAAGPPAAVAAVARQIKAAQGPEIEQIEQMLTDLGQPTGGGPHSGGHGGMMSDTDLDTLREAEGDDAARRYLEAMIAHHEGAIEAAEAELRDGTYEPARQLATSIAEDQAAEITRMERLLAAV